MSDTQMVTVVRKHTPGLFGPELFNGSTDIRGHSSFPDCLILIGEYTRSDIVKRMGGNEKILVEVFEGCDHPGLPFPIDIE